MINRQSLIFIGLKSSRKKYENRSKIVTFSINITRFMWKWDHLLYSREGSKGWCSKLKFELRDKPDHGFVRQKKNLANHYWLAKSLRTIIYLVNADFLANGNTDRSFYFQEPVKKCLFQSNSINWYNIYFRFWRFRAKLWKSTLSIYRLYRYHF